MIKIRLDNASFASEVSVQLPSSKSISNRVLMIHKIGELSSKIDNLSDANDTVFLKKILESTSDDVYCGAGGTTLRFYLSYCFLKDKPVVLRGDISLNSRPVFPLVNALTQLGADIIYLHEKGCAPIKIAGTAKKNSKVNLTANISSQFVSSLLLIAPYLPQGLEIEFPSAQVSRSYISMTISLMDYFGVKVEVFENRLIVKPQQYLNNDFHIPADWSAAIYWIGFIAILGKGKLFLEKLAKDELQGDEALLNWVNVLGITYRLTEKGIHFEKAITAQKDNWELDLSNNPDLAQPLVVITAALGIKAKFTGLSTLIHKETNRIAAISQELKKVGVKLKTGDDFIIVEDKVDTSLFSTAIFETYHDHRMAMSLSMFAACGQPIKINHPEVVAKSYPTFFEELKKIASITAE
ncbi:MAG: 3-phosphoshikimate 1-carboxyvinyltransferase [Bacteroidota bacterium]